uniref:Uncharacterized protein n=1 Tax=Timema douglasi TaxID=61478 RepID=A0A7R8VVV0_TIMDO|nr:unnamed protein product [Timema douglasi]
MQQTLEDEEEDAVSLYSHEYPSTDEKTGASSTSNVWENRLRFRKSLSHTESWVDASIQYTNVQTGSPNSDGVGQEEHGLVLYPQQSLEKASTAKPSDIAPNQNTIREKSLCDNSTALPLGENGSTLTPDRLIHGITCLDQVSDKLLVYKTPGETDGQAKLTESDCSESHSSREKLNRSNTEHPLVGSILSPSSRKESVSAMYLNNLHSDLPEAEGDSSESSVGISSSRPNACKYSEKHKFGSSASFASLGNGNIRLKVKDGEGGILEQVYLHLWGRGEEKHFVMGSLFSLKRSNDASVSSSCKKPKLVEEIEARVSSAPSEESTSPGRSSIDLNTSNVKNAHIDVKKMSSTNSPAVPKARRNVSLSPSEHSDIASSKENSPPISERTYGNKRTLEKDDPQNINFSPEEFIRSDLVRNRSAVTAKRKNRRTDKIENSSEINCPPLILDSEIAKVNDSFKIAEVAHGLTPNRRTGSQPKPDQGLETNSSLTFSTSHDSIFITQCRNKRSHESSLGGSSAQKNQNRLITPRTIKSFTLEKSTNLRDFDGNNKHNSILGLPGEEKLQEVPRGANSSLRSRFSTAPLKIKATPYRNSCVGKSIQTLNACDFGKEDVSNLCTEDSISKSRHKKNVFDSGTEEDMIDKIKPSVFLNYMKSGPSTAHETCDGDNTSNVPKRKKRYSLVMDISSNDSDTKPSKTTNKNSRLPTTDSLKRRKCKIVRSPSCSTNQKSVSGKAANLIRIDSKMAENSKKIRNSFEHGVYPTALQSEILSDENFHSLKGRDSILHSSSKKNSFLSLLNGNDASKQTPVLRGNKRDKIPETSTGAFNCNIIPCERKKKDISPERTKESISKREHIIPCDLKKKDNSPECIKEIISNRKPIIPLECQSFTHLYAIGDKPSKMNRSKLKKFRKIFMDKVTDQRLQKSNVCSENKSETKNQIRSSDSRLYLSRKSVLFVDKGGKQSIEQGGSTGEESENNSCEISELLHQENRTNPCSPIAAVSTNSQFFNTDRESHGNIFTDILLSEDIFTVSNKINKKLDKASLDSSSKARLIENKSLKLVSPISQELTDRHISEDKTRKKFVLAHEKLSTSNIYKRRRDASFTTVGCEEETTPGTLPRSDAEMMGDNIEKTCLKEVLDSSSCISSHKQDCKELAERKEMIDSEDKIDARHSSIFPSASHRNKSSDEDNFSLIQH